MEIAKFRVRERLFDAIIAAVKEKTSFDFKYTSGNMTIIAGEEYRFRIGSNLLHFIVIENNSPYLEIQVISGGGAQGLIGITWGAESATLKRFRKIFKSVCEQHGETLEELTK